MVWWVQPSEIADDAGMGTGTYRLTARSDEPRSGPYGLCGHAHASRAEAANCVEAREQGCRVTGIHSADCLHAQAQKREALAAIIEETGRSFR